MKDYLTMQEEIDEVLEAPKGDDQLPDVFIHKKHKRLVIILKQIICLQIHGLFMVLLHIISVSKVIQLHVYLYFLFIMYTNYIISIIEQYCFKICTFCFINFCFSITFIKFVLVSF